MITVDKLDRAKTQLLVVDVQERLLPHIDGHEGIVARIVQILKAAHALDVPATITEQYPEGLGATVTPIKDAADHVELHQKMAFSVLGDTAPRERIISQRRPQVLVCGIEAHVCVQQTVLDLLAEQKRPFVLADAISSRRAFDRDTALRRMEAAGAVVTTVESAIFELTGRSDGPLFKQILPIVK